MNTRMVTRGHSVIISKTKSRGGPLLGNKTRCMQSAVLEICPIRNTLRLQTGSDNGAE